MEIISVADDGATRVRPLTALLPERFELPHETARTGGAG